MANFVYNIALGRGVELYGRVDGNDPSTSALLIIAILTTEADGTLKDLDTMAAIESNANTAEVTNSGYARKVLTDTELTAWAPDDTNNLVLLDFPDQTWTGVAASPGAWSDLLVCYDANTGSGTDSDVTPITQHDFSVTPDGSDITAQVPNGFLSVS